MSAVKEERPRAKGAAEVEAFEKKYADALDEARVSEVHTATHGWQDLYQAHRTSVEKWRRDIGAILHDAATAIERGDIGDGPEESMAEAKKSFAAMRNVVKVFEARTVAPVKEAMERAHEVIEAARRDARAAESNSPLVAKGILEAVTNAIEAMPKVSFDDKTGRITIE